MCPTYSLAADELWGDKSLDYDVKDAPQEAAATATQNEKYIKDIEIHGANVVSPDAILSVMSLQKGGAYNREALQTDLKSIYQMGYFSERMKAIPVKNADGTITLKIIVEENAPVTDFTIEGNTVVSTEEILEFLTPMKGKPQNISKITARM